MSNEDDIVTYCHLTANFTENIMPRGLSVVKVLHPFFLRCRLLPFFDFSFSFLHLVNRDEYVERGQPGHDSVIVNDHCIQSKITLKVDNPWQPD